MATIYAASDGYLIVGSASVSNKGITASSDSYAVTGTTATLTPGFRITAASGTYVVTGTSADIERLNAFPGAYQIQGQVATLSRAGRSILATGGSYAVTGYTLTTLERALQIPNGAYALTGTAATLIKSVLSKTLFPVSGSYAVSGQTAVLELVLYFDSGDYNITGTAVTFRKGKKLIANTTSYTVAGPPTTIPKRNAKDISTSGVYTFSAPDTVLNYSSEHAKFVTAETGSYTYTGLNATLRQIAGAGSYSLTGTDAILQYGFTFDSGSYVISGTPILRQVHLIASPGVYTLTGTPANILYPVRVFPADSGFYTLFGATASLTVPRTMVATSGTYAITGDLAGLRITHLSVDPGVYSMSGFAANVFRSRRGRWRRQPPKPSSFTAEPVSTTTWDHYPPGPGVL